MVAISDPEAVKELFQKEGKFPQREPSLAAWTSYHKKNEMPDGVGIMSGPEWQRMRVSLNPKMMKPKQIDSYVPVLNSVSNDLMYDIDKLVASNDGVLGNMKNLFWQWTLEGAISTFYEKRLNVIGPNGSGDDGVKAATLIQDLVDAFFYVALAGPLTDNPLSPFRWKIHKIFDSIYTEHGKLFDEKMQEFVSKNQGTEIDENSEMEFIPYLFYNRQLSKKEILSNMLSLMIAAQDTTSSTFQWILLMLANHPDKQSILQEEIQSVFGDNPNDMSAKQLSKLKYFKAFMRETMRMRQPVPFNSRILDHDINLSGYHIPKNSMILSCTQATSMSPKIGPDYRDFRPERWLRTSEAIDPYLNLSFGHGQRMCIGKRLAETQISLLLSKLLMKYSVGCNLTADNEGTFNIVVSPDADVKYTFTPIN